jgi:hypothetical protein
MNTATHPHDPCNDYAALLDASSETINAEACRLMTDPERVLSFIRLIQWDREERIVAALAADQKESAGYLIWQRVNELAQECAKEEWAQ